jgi:hypothetical protein
VKTAPFRLPLEKKLALMFAHDCLLYEPSLA